MAPAASDAVTRRPVFIAHRGFSDRFPENTVGSILEAAAHGAEWIEVDVRPGVDGEPILRHDALDPADRRRPSTLAEALEALSPGRAKLYLHLKEPQVSRTLAERMIGLCRSGNLLGRVRFNSGTFSTLKMLRELDPDVWLEYDLYDAKGLLRSNRLTPEDLRAIRGLGVRSVGTFSFKIDDELVRVAHEHRLLVGAMISRGSPFLREAYAYRRMLQLGVDEIMTDEIAKYSGR